MLVSMKKVSLYAMKEDRDAILRSLQKTGDVMFVAGNDEKALPHASEVADQAQKASDAIKFLEQHATGKASLLAPKLPVPYEKFKSPAADAADLTDQVQALEEKITSLRNEAETMRVQVSKLTPWLPLDIPIEELTSTANTEIFAGFIADGTLEKLRKDLENLTCELKVLGVDVEGQAILVIAYKDDAAQVKHFLKTVDFVDFVFPKRLGTAQTVADDLTQAAAEKDRLADELVAETKKVATRKDDLCVYYDQLKARGQRMTASGLETEKTFHMKGWCRADRTQIVHDAIDQVTDVYDLHFEDPGKDDIPPTITENNSLVSPYEAVTSMYSVVHSGAFDPNPIMAPFFCCFFGMMLSDAGYGVVITILFLIAWKVFKLQGFAEKLFLVIIMGGISTIFWGAMFGGWFGLTWHPFMFEPMKEPLKMLILCYALGAIHLITGMCIKIYVETKRGNAVGAFLDIGSWLIIFAGLFIMGMGISPFGKYIALFGAAIVILFGDREAKNPIKRVFGGLYKLYGISGYLSDLLSYSRLFALGLATGVIAMVINTVAELLWKAGPIGIIVALGLLIGGHTMNIIINILGAYVHSSRLQYIEFFSKFFEGSGRAFKPLALITKYTEITK
jgi:V/A-type H+-transporting ATPase subunit I